MEALLKQIKQVETQFISDAAFKTPSALLTFFDHSNQHLGILRVPAGFRTFECLIHLFPQVTWKQTFVNGQQPCIEALDSAVTPFSKVMVAYSASLPMPSTGAAGPV